MLELLSPALRSLMERLLAAWPAKAPDLYLVGGVVRDLFLQRALHDLDFVVEGPALPNARRLADALGGAFFPLDSERDTARVIYESEATGRLVLDFAGLRGQTLENDLRGRDFTINALAINPRLPQILVDPTGGLADLRARRLRACLPTALEADPNRVLRAVRQAVALQFQIEPDTLRAVRQAAPLLADVSPERVRDEVLRTLGGVRVAAALRMWEMLGILPVVLPELTALKGVQQGIPHVHDVWEHTLEVVSRLESTLAALSPAYDPDRAGSLALGLAVMRLGRYRSQIGEHLDFSFTPERSLRPLLFLGALYHDVAKPQTRSPAVDGRVHFLRHDELGAEIASQRGHALRLSNEEIQRLKSIVRYHLRPFLLAQSGETPSRRAIYRFFRQANLSGVDVCLLSLADVQATYGVGLPPPVWTAHLEVVRSLLEAWWEKPGEAVAPPALLNGRDLIVQFELKPGRQLGEILDALREAQAVGQVIDRQTALEFVSDLLSSKVDQG